MQTKARARAILAMLVAIVLTISIMPLTVLASVQQQTNDVFISQVYVRGIDTSFTRVPQNVALDSNEAISTRNTFEQFFSNNLVGIYLTDPTAKIALKPVENTNMILVAWNAEANTTRILNLSTVGTDGFWHFDVPTDATFPMRLVAATVVESGGLVRGDQTQVPAQPTSPTPQPVPPASTQPTPPPTSTQPAQTTSGYQRIFNDYAARIRAAAPNVGMMELAEIANEGVLEMASYMLTARGTDGQYTTYEMWATRLMDVYLSEAR